VTPVRLASSPIRILEHLTAQLDLHADVKV
jgi:hypothetical protein